MPNSQRCGCGALQPEYKVRKNNNGSRSGSQLRNTLTHTHTKAVVLCMEWGDKEREMTFGNNNKCQKTRTQQLIKFTYPFCTSATSSKCESIFFVLLFYLVHTKPNGMLPPSILFNIFIFFLFFIGLCPLHAH